MLRRLLDLFVLGIEDFLLDVEVLLRQLVEGHRSRSATTGFCFLVLPTPQEVDRLGILGSRRRDRTLLPRDLAFVPPLSEPQFRFSWRPSAHALPLAYERQRHNPRVFRRRLFRRSWDSPPFYMASVSPIEVVVRSPRFNARPGAFVPGARLFLCCGTTAPRTPAVREEYPTRLGPSEQDIAALQTLRRAKPRP